MMQEQDFWSQFQPAEDDGSLQPPGMPGAGFMPGENPPGTRPGGIIPPQDTSGGVTGPGIPPPGGAPAAGGGSRGTFGQQWTSSGGRTVADLQAFVQRWNAANPNAPVTLGGSKGDKVYGPGGEYWADAVISAGINGGQGATWNEDTGGGAGGNFGTGVGFGDYTKPFGERYELPSLSDLQHMPGYQAGLNAYTGAIQTGAAAKGTLLTGGLQQRLGQAAGDYTQQAYGQLAGLQGGAFDRNYNIFRNNQNDPFNKYYSLAELGKPR